MYSVSVSSTFIKQFSKLSKNLRNRIKAALKELENDPLEPRVNVDKKPLKGTKPQKNRLRVGDYRIIYLVEKKKVRVIELFKRSRGYR
jgi:addiction module RelE/StbE family toxin